MKTKLFLTVFCALALLPGHGQAQQTPPRGGEPKAFNLPEKTTFTLDNGLSVTLVPYGAVPKVNASFVVRAGNLNEAAEETWLADLTANFLKEGTASRTAKQIAEEAAEIGGSVDANAGPDRTTIDGEALAEFAPELITLLSDILMNPAFPGSEIDRLKNDMVRQLSVQKSQPQAQAREKYRAVLYADHPYGRSFPTESTIAGFDIDKVKEFYSANFGAGRTHLYVVGKFDKRKVEKAVRRSLGGWREGSAIVENFPQPISARKVHLIDRPGAPQSTIILGCPVVDPSHQDYVPMLVMNSLLGGSFASRITSNIREDKGYTYSPRSRLSTRYRDCYWAQTADVTTKFTGASLKEIFFEIERLQNEPPAAEELEAIQNFMAGIFVLQNSSRTGIIGQLSFLDLHGLDESYLTTYVSRVYELTPADLQRVAGQYLEDDKMTIVVVGDIQKIRSQVARFGDVIL